MTEPSSTSSLPSKSSATCSAMARVLLVDPFLEGSHRAWADGLAAYSEHEVVQLGLENGSWRERMRRGSQLLAERAAAEGLSADLLLVTDMLDLPLFLALSRPRFAHTPILAYFHENQFTYPRIRQERLNSWFGQMNYATALAADVVAFNSEFHRRDFLRALRAFESIPNNWYRPGSADAIERKAAVLPPGIELRALQLSEPLPRDERRILWNARWEFDKGPTMLARLLTRLAAEGVPFTVAIAGDPGPNPDRSLFALRDALGERVVHFGFAPDRRAYARLLWSSGVVLSTARHEFFGLGFLEAMACGCVPLAPAAQNYPDIVPEAWHGRCLYADEEEAAVKIAAVLDDPPPRDPFRAAAAAYDWERVAPRWDALFDALLGGEAGIG